MVEVHHVVQYIQHFLSAPFFLFTIGEVEDWGDGIHHNGQPSLRFCSVTSFLGCIHQIPRMSKTTYEIDLTMCLFLVIVFYNLTSYQCQVSFLEEYIIFIV